MTARGALDRALEELVAAGSSWPCAVDPDRWFDGGPVRLAKAAHECAPCPVLALCGAVGDEEQHRYGIWGGRILDREAARAAS